MIRVNLLATQAGEAPAREWFPREQRSAAMGLALLLVAAVGTGGYWWYLSSQRASVETRITDGQLELDRLNEASELVTQANARKAELTERLTLIERLRESKRGPVSLLETISNSLPDGLWLLEVEQTGTSVEIDGRALSLTSVTDFAQRMQNSGLFQRPVEILTTSSEVVDETGVIRFSVKAETITPALTSPTVTAAAPPAQPGV